MQAERLVRPGHRDLGVRICVGLGRCRRPPAPLVPDLEPLSDADRRYLDQLGLREVASSPLPATFTLFPGLTIHAAYNGYWFWGRAPAQELRADFRAISRAGRPDWDPPSA